MGEQWCFDVSPDTAVVTTTYVTVKGMPILYVSHEIDEEEGTIWQFHAGNDDYRPEVLQLVRIDEVVAKDPTIESMATLPAGYHATRNAVGDLWVIQEG